MANAHMSSGRRTVELYFTKGSLWDGRRVGPWEIVLRTLCRGAQLSQYGVRGADQAQQDTDISDALSPEGTNRSAKSAPTTRFARCLRLGCVLPIRRPPDRLKGPTAADLPSWYRHYPTRRPSRDGQYT